MLGVPSDIVDATEHLLRLADDWTPRQVDLAHVNGRALHLLGRLRARRRRSCAASTPTRALKARLKQWYFAYAAVATFSKEYVVRPPRLEAHVGGEVLRGVTAARAERRPLHLLRPIARSTSPKGSRSTTASTAA